MTTSDEELRRIYREIAGENAASPALQREMRDEQEQRVLIAKSMSMLMEHTHPLVLMSMLVVALAYMSDDYSVNREHLCKLLREAHLSHPVEIVGSGLVRPG